MREHLLKQEYSILDKENLNCIGMHSNIEKRTATITWITYHNFGTYLQAYALQKVIRYLGYENHIISDRRIVDSQCEANSFRNFIAKVYHFFCGNRQIVKGRKREKASYDKFVRQYLYIDDSWLNYSDLDNKYDIYICGSDQIWTPNFRKIEEFYFGGFTSKKKIAYAPSIGQKYCSQEYVMQVKPLLEQFKYLSIREITGQKLLTAFLDKPIRLAVDPTLLLPSCEWLTLAEASMKDIRPYVLCYFLTYNELYMDLVTKFAQMIQMPVKIFITDKRFIEHADISLFSGPIEFLQEVKNASYFFTDSYHGSIFAVIFEKRFWTFKRFKDGERNNQNSRIEDFFRILGLSDYFVDNIDLREIINIPPINYDKVKQVIQVERMRSMDYLKYSLKY